MAKAVKYFDHDFLQRVSAKSTIGSAHWSILGNSGKVSYVFIAMQPNTYVRPHCHPNPLLWGTQGSQFVIVLTGKIALILIDPKTGVMKRSVLSATGGDRAVEIPGGVYHSSVALTASTTILEVVEPGINKKYLKGSPKFGSTEAKQLVKLWIGTSKSSFQSPLLKVG